MTHDTPELTDLPRYVSRSGSLCFMQEGDQVPFEIDHVSWMALAQDGQPKGRSAVRSSEAVVVALSGSFSLELGAGDETRQVKLDRPDRSRYAKGSDRWTLRDQSAGAIALVVASDQPDGRWTGGTPASLASAGETEPWRSTVDDCEVVQLPRSDGPLGRAHMLRFDEKSELRTRRVYYLTDIPLGAARGGHAHRALYQYVVAAKGGFSVHLDDGVRKRSISLTRPDRALMLVPGIWRVLDDFSAGSVCLVMASARFDEGDYLRRYRDFRSFKTR